MRRSVSDEHHDLDKQVVGQAPNSPTTSPHSTRSTPPSASEIQLEVVEFGARAEPVDVGMDEREEAGMLVDEHEAGTGDLLVDAEPLGDHRRRTRSCRLPALPASSTTSPGLQQAGQATPDGARVAGASRLRSRSSEQIHLLGGVVAKPALSDRPVVVSVPLLPVSSRHRCVAAGYRRRSHSTTRREVVPHLVENVGTPA